MFDKNIFAQRFRALRNERNLTQDQLAADLSVTKTYVSDIERARRTTTLEKCYELADYFEVSLDYLVGQSDYSYRFTESNDHVCKTYGITAVAPDARRITILDIGISLEEIFKLVEELNRNQLSVVHFRDVICDFISKPSNG